MIIGVGTDMIEIQRVERACQKQAFFARCFTLNEQKLIHTSSQRAAGNFAVKEAVSKVLGTGIRGFDLRDIEVLRNEYGKPYVNLYNGADAMAKSLHISHIHVSISNTKEYAIAFAVGEGEMN